MDEPRGPLVTLEDIEENNAAFRKSLEGRTRPEIWEEFRNEFPELAKGKSRIRKADLINCFVEAKRDEGLSVLEDQYHASGQYTVPVFDDQKDPIEEPPAPPKGPDLPIREYAGLRFVVFKGDPMRPLSHQEENAMQYVAKMAPLLKPKYQTAPKGMPGRRVFDPQKKERAELKRCFTRLERWGKIHVLPPETKEAKKDPPRVLSQTL